jgi:hypothetical protein
MNQNKITTKIFVKDKILDKDIIFTNPNINKSVIEFVKWEDKDTMVNQVFPGESSLTPAWGSRKRPFKICPIKYDDLLKKSNIAKYNLCVFDEEKIIGICVIPENSEKDFYWLEIICSNTQGIGGYIMILLLNLLNDKKIFLKAEKSIIPFYTKYGFEVKVKLEGEYYGMIYNPIIT